MNNEFYTLDDVRDMLRLLDCGDTDCWLTAMFAIKHEFGESGFSVWDDWSQGWQKYKAAQARSSWRSAKPAGVKKTVTLGSLVHLAKSKGYQKDHTLSPEDLKRLQQEHEARRERVLKQQAEDEAWSKKMADVVADAACYINNNFLGRVGSSPYIGKKGIKPYGALFPRAALILNIDIKNESWQVISGKDEIGRYWERRKTDEGKAAEQHQFSLSINRGCVVLPCRNIAGSIRNLQVITRAKDSPKKLFIKCGQKTGTYLRLGDGNADEKKLVCEGWATGCSLHEASGLETWVTWDCGGLLNFANEMLEQGYTNFLICGDDDHENEKNPGKHKAQAAAQILQCGSILPRYPSDFDRAGLTDFDDLRAALGLEALAAQIEEGINQQPELPEAPPIDDVPPEYIEYSHNDHVQPPAPPINDGRPDLEKCLQRYAFIADDGKVWDSHSQKVLKPSIFKSYVTPAIYKSWVEHENRRDVQKQDILPHLQATRDRGVVGLQRALKRYIYLDPSQNVWDAQEREVVPINSLRLSIAACFNEWIAHPERRQIRADDLVFDPTQQCGQGSINRFKGLPLIPEGEHSKCDAIGKLLMVLCNDDLQVITWLTKWLAYPLQNVGAKMQTSVLMHSDVHGSGKSYFFDGVMGKIYGEYCSVFGQAQLESQYNDWMSEVLFGVFEEVLSRSQKYNHSGTIKQMVTGKTFYVNKKFVSGWTESNHMNMVFISNEVQPLPVEPSDRRFLVVWPESKLFDELKLAVDHELKNGGAEAFYKFLLGMDLTGFTPYTEPPMTEAKKRLVDFGRPIWEMFYEDWRAGSLGLPYTSVRSADLYLAFVQYCKAGNESCMGRKNFTQLISSKEKFRRDVNFSNEFISGKASFFIVTPKPENQTQQVFLAGCVQEWQRILGLGNNEDFQQAS